MFESILTKLGTHVLSFQTKNIVKAFLGTKGVFIIDKEVPDYMLNIYEHYRSNHIIASVEPLKSQLIIGTEGVQTIKSFKIQNILYCFSQSNNCQKRLKWIIAENEKYEIVSSFE